MHSANAPNKTLVLAQLAAYLLIIASAGLGCIYIVTITSAHGKIMTAFSVLFVLGLEITKPLSVAFAFEAFRKFELIKGLLLTVLGLFAVLYSLTAELALLYGSRSDFTAERKSQSFHAGSSQKQYEKAAQDLQSLPKARSTVEEVKADIVALNSKYPDVDCNSLHDKRSRVACPQLAKLHGEIGIIEKREKLQATVDGFVSKAPEVAAQKLADPSASAISTYLNALGVRADQKVIAEWVILIPIIAMELGSALGLLLVNVIASGAKNDDAGSLDPRETPRETAKRAILGQLRDTPEVMISQRELARRQGLDKSTIQRAMQELRSEGVIDLDAARVGTKMKLRKQID